MPPEIQFRIALVNIIVVTMAVALYHRLQAAATVRSSQEKRRATSSPSPCGSPDFAFGSPPSATCCFQPRSGGRNSRLTQECGG